MLNKCFGIATDATCVFMKQLTLGRTFKCFCNVNSACWAPAARLTAFKTQIAAYIKCWFWYVALLLWFQKGVGGKPDVKVLVFYHQWYPEVNHFCRGVPLVLIGCKTDLRKDKEQLRKLRASKQEPITYNQVNISAFKVLSSLQEIKHTYFSGIVPHKYNHRYSKIRWSQRPNKEIIDSQH